MCHATNQSVNANISGRPATRPAGRAPFRSTAISPRGTSDFRMSGLLGRLTACAIVGVQRSPSRAGCSGQTTNNFKAYPCNRSKKSKSAAVAPCARALRWRQHMADDLVYSAPTYTERANTAITTSANGGTDWSGWERWLRGHLDIETQAIAEIITETIDDLEAKHDRQIRELELKLAECVGAINVLRTGKNLRVRGTFDEGARYEQLDVVAFNGSSFVALEDRPGRCPGPNWQLLASAGRRGERGSVGPRGERGLKGEPAEAGQASWRSIWIGKTIRYCCPQRMGGFTR
jgi:hypothetical protein